MTRRPALCLLLAVVGCASGKDDAPVDTDTLVDGDSDVETDGATDTPDESDAPAGSEVRVRVVAVGKRDPVQFADVFSSDADGEPVDSAVTDAAGEARLFVPEGGSVSLAERLERARSLETAFDVPAGGEVVFQSSAFLGSGDDTGVPRPFEITATGSPAGADLWAVATSCGGANSLTPTRIEVDNEGCPGRTLQDVLVVASDDGVPVAWGALADVDVSSGDELFVVPLTASAARTFDVSIVNPPAGLTSARLTASLDIDGDADPAPDSEQVGGFTGSVERTLTLPGIPGGRVRLIASVELGTRTKTAERFSATATPTLELDASALAEVAPRLDASGERPEVGWVLTPGGRGDGGTAIVYFQSVDVDNALWRIRFDASARDGVRMPRLPEALAGFQGRADGTADLGVLTLIDRSWVDDYAGFLRDEATPTEATLLWSSAR